ncbi:protoporphyrinogen oxidase [Actinophytocola sediminis]
MSRVVVVGGGVSGLVAAYRLRELLGEAARITLVEQGDRLGGKLRTVEVGGVPSDVGAEAFVLRNPAAVELVAELGLAERLIHPGGASATVRAGGRTVALPKRTFLGVPAEAGAVGAVLSDAGAARVAAEESLPPLRVPGGGDLSVGAVLAERFGRELVDHLVEPLLGGVYAGRADLLGLRATMPALVDALDEAGGSLTRAAARVLGAAGGVGTGGQPGAGDSASVSRPAARSGPGAGGSGDVAGAGDANDVGRGVDRPGVGSAAGAGAPGVGGSGVGRRPVFGALRGGMGVLVDRLVERARVDVRLGVPVRELTRTPGGWRVEIGSPGRAEAVHADAVVLAVPPPAARRLLADVSPAAAAAYAGIEVGSMAVVSLAFPDGTRLPDTSGVLLAVGERRGDGTPFTAKACTHTSVKWPSDPPRLRASVGRVGETELLRRDDQDLVAGVLADLADLTGMETPPIDWRVTRWGGGLPQYGVGHVAAVETVERAVESLPGLAVAGASFRGVGIPACVATATSAARRVAAHLLAHPDTR